MKDVSNSVSSFFFFYFFAAGGTFSVLKELRFTTTAIRASNHQACAALLASFLYKGGFAAHGAIHIERSSATIAETLSFFDRAVASGTMIAKGAHAATTCAIAGISLDHGTAMDAGLFVKGHNISSLLCRL